MEPLVLTIAEAAEALKVSERLAYALAAEGVLPIVKLGARRVVPVEALKQMLADRTEWSPDTNPGLRLAGKPNGEVA